MNNELFRPPPNLSVSQWADNFRYLSSEASAEPGRWITDRAPYQRGMMDAIKQCERLVIMTAAQVGKTELLLNTIGYFADQDPSPMLMVQPTLQMGEDFSKNKLFPMLRDTPCLSAKIPIKSRNSDNNILYKKFSNGAYVAITGANSPAGLASRSVRVLLCDEVDRYPGSAGEEGDPLSLAIARTSNFWNRRIILVSTPTLKAGSRIEKAFELSTREEWCVPCPTCGTYQPYSWSQIVYKDRTEPVMKCVHCGREHGASEWKAGRGRWDAQAESTTRGFHVNAFASPWVKWADIVANYHESYNGGDEMMKTWYNTKLGETYELTEGSIEIETVTSRLEPYPKFPDEVQILTCGEYLTPLCLAMSTKITD